MKNIARWIWYPADFEIIHANKLMTSRYERDIPIPPFWKMDDCYHNVKFIRKFHLNSQNTISIKAEGQMNILLNDQYVYNIKDELVLNPGKYEMVISVYNAHGLPCIYVSGNEIISDENWLVTCNDHAYKKAASSNLVTEDSTPNNLKFPQKELKPKLINYNGYKVYDFGLEILAYVKLKGIKGNGDLTICYGESLPEAVDFEHAETIDVINIDLKENYTTSILKAFRYLTLDSKFDVTEVTALYEYLPVNKSYFKSSNELLNKIYDVALHTLHLNTKEFMIDGIKRDRWLWSGDAYQSYLMNYYSFFDKAVVQRTILALFGKLPVKTHINHIMDYSFYWIMSFYDYYLYTGDLTFIVDNFDKITALIEFCLSRRNEAGFMEGLPEDWVFVDWADLDNRGEVCFEQLLLFNSLKICVKLGKLINQADLVEKYGKIAQDLEAKIEKFWHKDLNAYIYAYKNGVPDNVVTKHANMIALLFDLCTDSRKQLIKDHVLLNDSITKITTPYMRFYELAALCEVGELEYVFDEIIEYWGGMLEASATSFWETYNPDEIGNEKYGMYGRKYGKSLCHAWGASPLYLLGRYFIGLKPTKPGYQEFVAQPKLVKMSWFETKVPLNEGYLHMYYSEDKMKIFSSNASGKIILQGNFEIEGAKSFCQNNETIIPIDSNKEYCLKIVRIEEDR